MKLFSGFVKKTRLKTITRQLVSVLSGHACRSEGLQEVVVHVAAKVAGVVGVDHGAQAGIKQLRQVVIC